MASESLVPLSACVCDRTCDTDALPSQQALRRDELEQALIHEVVACLHHSQATA
eukprot:CAMPEP_0115157198 /NCGR_PEP_ID=MMETSP0227-20121206/68918_1 /TAXON_ID=89957 /ORGANISM="Polarella glacialis, Strain CCMP 1383" /LENGTH=53 /DNA_ID=CAMNT_0002568561 /DNA_START=353 /DNA_END=511 /DNA_ORIENTATION=-